MSLLLPPFPLARQDKGSRCARAARWVHLKTLALLLGTLPRTPRQKLRPPQTCCRLRLWWAERQARPRTQGHTQACRRRLMSGLRQGATCFLRPPCPTPQPRRNPRCRLAPSQWLRRKRLSRRKPCHLVPPRMPRLCPTLALHRKHRCQRRLRWHTRCRSRDKYRLRHMDPSRDRCRSLRMHPWLDMCPLRDKYLSQRRRPWHPQPSSWASRHCLCRLHSRLTAMPCLWQCRHAPHRPATLLLMSTVEASCPQQPIPPMCLGRPVTPAYRCLLLTLARCTSGAGRNPMPLRGAYLAAL